jgi:hypothetical protein
VVCHPAWGADYLLERNGYYFGLSGSSILEAFDWEMEAYDTLSRVFLRSSRGTLEPAVIVQNRNGLGSQPISILGLEQFRAELASRNKADDARRIAAIRAKRWSTEMTRAVINHQVAVGMTAEMVRMSWGEPRSINRTVTTGHTTEQWVYSMRSLVYLRDGLVTAIQTSK